MKKAILYVLAVALFAGILFLAEGSQKPSYASRRISSLQDIIIHVDKLLSERHHYPNEIDYDDPSSLYDYNYFLRDILDRISDYLDHQDYWSVDYDKL